MVVFPRFCKVSEEIIYAIQLDSLALKEISKKIVKALLDDGEKFSAVEVSLSDIKKAPPRDTPEKAIRTFRTILYLTNWEFWIKKNISFPISGKSRGYFNDSSITKMKINSIYEWHEVAGLLVLIDRSDLVMDHPLTDIKIDGKHKNVFELYNEWHDMEY